MIRNTCHRDNGEYIDKSETWKVHGKVTQYLKSGDGARVLGGLALRVVEVGGHSDDRLLDRLAQERLGGLLHLGEHHRGDLLGREQLDLALELDLDHGLIALGDDLEGPVLHVVLHRLIHESKSVEKLNEYLHNKPKTDIKCVCFRACAKRTYALTVDR